MFNMCENYNLIIHVLPILVLPILIAGEPQWLRGVPFMPAHNFPTVPSAYQMPQQYAHPNTMYNVPPPSVMSQDPFNQIPSAEPANTMEDPIPEVGDNGDPTDAIQKKIISLIMLSSIEQSLRQMYLVNPDVISALAGKNLTDADVEGTVDDQEMGRRFLFTPTIQNTIINSNENKNTNANNNNNAAINGNSNGNNVGSSDSPPAYVPYPIPVNPNFPLLTYLLGGLLKKSGKAAQEHVGHKPVRVCFEL